MLLTKTMFFKRVHELVKIDGSYFNCICEVMKDFELDGEEVGEWIKDDPTLLQYIKAEFKIKSDINDLF